MKRVCLAIVCALLLWSWLPSGGAQTYSTYSTAGTGTTFIGSGPKHSVVWSSDFDGVGGTLNVLVRDFAGNVRISCSSFYWGGPNADGSVTAQGSGLFLGMPRTIILHVAHQTPLTCVVAVHDPFIPKIFTFNVTVSSGSLTVQ